MENRTLIFYYSTICFPENKSYLFQELSYIFSWIISCREYTRFSLQNKFSKQFSWHPTKILEWMAKFIQYSEGQLCVAKDKNRVHYLVLNSTLIFLDLRFCYHLLNASSVYCNFTYMILGKYLGWTLCNWPISFLYIIYF